MQIDTAQKVRAAMLAQGITQEQLAQRLGVPRQSVGRTMSRALVDERSLWPAILAELGLSVQIVPDNSGDTLPKLDY